MTTGVNFVTLEEPNGGTALIAPELGAWLLRYARPLPGHGLVEALHHDPAVVARYPSGMYAGNPILFPLASKNVVDGQDHRYRWEGRCFEMPQHGFARRMPWAVTERSAASVTMELNDTPQTRENYPFAFRMRLTFRLEADRLHWEQTVENRSPGPLPFSTGFHPYLPLPLTPKGRVLRHSFVIIWSRSPSDPFYCIEPWTALPNAFSREEAGELILVPPGGEFRAAMFLEVRPIGAPRRPFSPTV